MLWGDRGCKDEGPNHVNQIKVKVEVVDVGMMAWNALNQFVIFLSHVLGCVIFV